MATAVLPQSLGGTLPQTVRHKVEERPKRRRAKNVTWPTEDKLCQVRLFTADDEPSLSGTDIQDLLQAKQTRFLHAATPVSTDDLPPGFEGVAAKRARLDATSITAMATQTPWRCPEKFALDPSWVMVAGGESTEVTSQRQREVRVLEAVYPRHSAIPHSPAEPQEKQEDIDDALIPTIPLVPVEDEEENFEEDSLQGLPIPVAEVDASSGTTSNCLESGKRISPTGQHNLSRTDSHSVGAGRSVSPVFAKVDSPTSGLGPESLRNADPNIAAAAAAAYAAVKVMEGGSMIDHELLIKILSNPILVETLIASSQKSKNLTVESRTASSNSMMANGNHISHSEQINGGSCRASSMLASQATSTTLPPMNGGSKLVASYGGKVLQQGVRASSRLQAWNGAASGVLDSLDRSLTAINAQEQTNMRTGALRHANLFLGMNSQVYGQPLKGSQTNLQAVAPPGRPPSQQDYFKELIQKHGVVRSSNESQSVQGLEVNNHIHHVDRHRTMGLGSKVETQAMWIGNDQITAASLLKRVQRDDATSGSYSEVARVKPWKPCLYFNTPRGCRNGVNCNFVHETGIEKLELQRTSTDIPVSAGKEA